MCLIYSYGYNSQLKHVNSSLFPMQKMYYLQHMSQRTSVYHMEIWSTSEILNQQKMNSRFLQFLLFSLIECFIKIKFFWLNHFLSSSFIPQLKFLFSSISIFLKMGNKVSWKEGHIKCIHLWEITGCLQKRTYTQFIPHFHSSELNP